MDVAGEMRSSRRSHLKTGVWLAASAVAWNLVAGAIAVAAEAPLVRSRWLPSEWIPFIETTSGALLGWRFVWELRGDSGNQAAWENARVSTVLYGAGASLSPLVFACGLSAPGWNHNYVRYCAVRGTRQSLLPANFRLTDFDRSGHSHQMRSGLLVCNFPKIASLTRAESTEATSSQFLRT
jgi:hypothetical protein